MREKIDSYRRAFKPVKIYLEDIKNIYKILSSLGGEISIETQDHILDSFDELKDLCDNRIENLKITSCKPYVTFEICRDGNQIYVCENSAPLRGVLEKVYDIVKKRRRVFLSVIQSQIFRFISSLMVCFFVVFNETLKSVFVYPAVVLMGLTAITLMVLYFVGVKGLPSIVILKNKNECRNNFIKNKEKIFIKVLLLIIGAILTLMVQFLSRL